MKDPKIPLRALLDLMKDGLERTYQCEIFGEAGGECIGTISFHDDGYGKDVRLFKVCLYRDWTFDFLNPVRVGSKDLWFMARALTRCTQLMSALQIDPRS